MTFANTVRILLVAFLCIGPAASQSRRPTAVPNDKPNARTATTPTPMPTATPADTDTLSDDTEIIKVATQLVSVPVRVMDRKGRFVAGLAKENFQVFENGAAQQIELFSNEHEPFTVALMLDMSYSTKFKIAEIQAAAIAFIDQLRKQDKVMVVSFDGDVHMLCEATDDRQWIYRAIKSTKINTGTSLYEAVDMVMNERLREIDGRKAIILFTDGVDTTSRRSNDWRNLSDAMELDALIYPVRYDTFADVQDMKKGPARVSLPSIFDPQPAPGGTLPYPVPTIPAIGRPGDQGTTQQEYARAAEYLDQLAMRTGGRLYNATTLGNLADAYARIAGELREFYSIGYYPSQDRAADKRSDIKIKVDQPGLTVRSRSTFIRRKAK